MKNNYKIIRTIFENAFQRVLECKDDKTDEIFYSNVIMNKKVINLINLENLSSLNSNVIESYCTNDRLYIFTNQLKSYAKSLREYTLNNELTIKQQFDLTKKIIELSINTFNMTDVVQKKILDLDKIFVDSKGELLVDLNLVFEQEYDISNNETFKSIGNMIHFIFSKTEIEDYNISELVPPDILKIIVRLLTQEYMHPKDALRELLNSPIFNMITSFSSKENKKVENKIKNTVIDDLKKSNIIISNEFDKDENEKKEVNEIKNQRNKKAVMEAALGEIETTKIFNDEIQDKVIFDIYLNDEEENVEEDEDNKFSFIKDNFILKAILSIVLVIFILLAGKFLINKFKESKEVSSNLNNVNINEENSNANNSTEQVDIDSVNKYLNDELIKNSGYTGDVAIEDKEIYVEGSKSLLINNKANDIKKALFATVNFKNESNKYMLEKQIAISAKAKSEKDVTASVVLEAYKDNKIISTFKSNIKIYNDIWSQILIPVNMADADSLNVYIEYEGENKIWIDSLLIDVVK